MAFILGALDKEIRLSFAQRIKGTLPEPYIPLITEGKEKDTPDFKYLSESKSMVITMPFVESLLTMNDSDPLLKGRTGNHATYSEEGRR